ncbi:MAG: hypothetical protein ACI3VR_01290 [Intestinibacter sp.]|uniref:OB-fold protein n=1 Tax=Intestinibacter sp. TaxID=1965304 RepID=UPI003F13A35E
MMMKEYKRCKYCSMEMDKSAIKCPHCNKIQATKFSISGKSENLVIALLIIAAIIVGFSSKLSNIQNSLDSVTTYFETSDVLKEVSNEAQRIIAFFDDDEDYDDYEEYIEVYAEDLAYDFEDDFDAAYDYYSDSTIEITGEIKKIESDSNGVYVYLDTYDSEYSICICISKDNTDDVDYVNSLEPGDYITYMGDFYHDSSSEYEMYLRNGYVV